MPFSPADHHRLPALPALQERLAQAERFRRQRGRPFITVSYAQSIDGSIASCQRQPLALSGQASSALTHCLRSAHATILVGIGTVLTDNPRLNVRLVPGPDPRPVVLDTHFRTPPDSRLLQRSGSGALIVGAWSAANARPARLEACGAAVARCALGPEGRLDLAGLMALLAEKAVNSVMVEGGARVITSFIRARLVDQFVITIAPRLVGGLPVINPGGMPSATGLRLTQTSCQALGEDLVLWAQPAWEEP